MADKEIRKMNRTELIEIIYALQQNERSLREENEELRKQLDDKQLKIENAGSIAEAALGLNHIFEDAEAAAQQYLDSLRDADERASKIVSDAESKAETIISDAEEQARQTEEECSSMREKTEQDVASFIKSVTQTLEKYPGLAGLVKEDANEQPEEAAKETPAPAPAEAEKKDDASVG